MPLTLNEDERMIRDTAKEFFAERAPVSQLRALRDGKDPDGFSRELWKEMAELGWAGIILPENYGGADFGYRGLGFILEEAGRTLAASPLEATVLIGASAILLGGNEGQRNELLPAIAKGELLLALALEEGARHAPYHVATKAEKSAKGYSLTGKKQFVLDGHVADKLIVVARSSGKPGERKGLTLFLVDAGLPGLKVTRSFMIDSRNAAEVSLENVKIPAAALLGVVDNGADLLDEVLDRARIGLAAVMLGGAQEAFERTLQYLKDRKQFGVAIGSFQALQHRAADLFTELEITRSAVLDALDAIDSRRNDVALAASLAKARASETFEQISKEAIQMHGGIGMTDEFEIGFFLKRARVLQAVFGDARFHTDRYATLEGY
jgi:alkylation response protein AidB-like acyl-CoA dehydrogenase